MPKLTYTEKWYQAAHCILDARGCFSKPMKDLNFVAMQALLSRKFSDGLTPAELAVIGPVDHQRGYKSNLSGEIIRQRMQEQPERFADPDRENAK